MRTSRWVLCTYAAIILFGMIAAIPNLFPTSQLANLPGWVPKQQVTLGLDLRGGSHLVLEVDAEALKTARLETLLADIRNRLQDNEIQLRSSGIVDDEIVVTVADPDQAGRARSLLRDLNGNVGGSALTAGSPEFDIGSSGSTFQIRLTEAGFSDRLNAAVDQSLEIIRQRVDQVGIAEPVIQRIGDDRILVQLPGLQDPTHLRELLGSTAQMSFHMLALDASAEGRTASGVTALPAAEGPVEYPVEDRVAISGERLTDARSGFDQQTGAPIVSFRFDTVGARQFAEITKNNVGRPFAIVLDGKVLSAPVINEPITGGSGQISGDFTVEETTTLSALLRAGALPAPLTVIEERSVGPDLGSDAIKMGVIAGLAGFALVAAFMVVLYRSWGLIANLALTVNTILTVGALSLLGATLTLPGIAGIILGIGMAVDANVLINERIREESAKGASALKAIDTGFQRAYSTIVDSNVTTLIATTLLFMFGSGPIRGFAITMMLGIGISMFTAVALVRVVMTEIARRRKLKQLDLKPLIRLAPQGTAISFMKARFIGIGLSIALSLASVGLFMNPGLSYGIDFKGGIQMEVRTDGPADLGQMRQAFSQMQLGEVALQAIGDDESVLVRVERQSGGEEAQTLAAQTLRQTIAEVAPGSQVESTDIVGPKISSELAWAGILAVTLATFAMLGYIWWRFEWHFAVGAIATLALDTTKMLGFFALTGLDFNLTAIAALLTIIGYSVNDKVVVYDRMRENLRRFKAMPLRSVIDKSINETLARCIFTSVTTFLAVLPMAIWGGPAVASFAIPMLFGVVIAASSSIFVAAPLLMLLGDWRSRRGTPLAETTPQPGTSML